MAEQNAEATQIGICYGCEHCGCDPTDLEDWCEVCDDCPDGSEYGEDADQ